MMTTEKITRLIDAKKAGKPGPRDRVEIDQSGNVDAILHGSVYAQEAFKIVKPYLPEGCEATVFYQLRDQYQILTRRNVQCGCLQREVKAWGKE